MRNILPISDLQRQAAQILNEVVESDEPAIITQRGRAVAVIVSADRFAQMEADLKILDDLELLRLVEEGKKDVESGAVLSHEEGKHRLKMSE